MNDRFKFRIWNGTEMHYNDFVVTATGFVGKITEEFLGKCVFNQEDLTLDKECILMQSTGLKDKNGKLIYEGDIVTYEWLESNGRCWRTDGKEIVKWNFGFVHIANIADYKIKNGTARNVQVIGNIYENKELLNDRKTDNNR